MWFVCLLGWVPRASSMLSKYSPIEHYLIPECIILKIIRTVNFIETKRCHGKPLIYPLPQWSRGTEQTHRWPHRWSVAKREGVPRLEVLIKTSYGFGHYEQKLALWGENISHHSPCIHNSPGLWTSNEWVIAGAKFREGGERGCSGTGHKGQWRAVMSAGLKGLPKSANLRCWSHCS